MELGLEGRVAIIAAASRGLGKAAACALAREGAHVVIAARGAADLERAAKEIRRVSENGGLENDVLAVRADVSVEADIAALVDATKERFGRIDVLVNNAGGPRAGRFSDMEDTDWLGAINLNLMSTIRLTRLVLPDMRSRHWGRIINITSFAVKQPIPNLILSNTARSGVVAMAKTLADEVAAEGITVNNVCPGYILTDRVRRLARATAQTQNAPVKDVLAAWEASIPAGRLGKPTELAAVIAFLASEQASYVTGTTLQVDGGLVAGLL